MDLRCGWSETYTRRVGHALDESIDVVVQKLVKALHVELCNIIVVTNVTLKRKFDTNYIDLLRLEILTKLCFC